MEPQRSLHLGALAALLAGSLLWIEFALRLGIAFLPVGSVPRAILWFGGLTVAIVFVLPLAWRGGRPADVGATLVGVWGIASFFAVWDFAAGTLRPEGFLFLVPYVLAAVALLVTGLRGWRTPR
jgi:hypothetical protein